MVVYVVIELEFPPDFLLLLFLVEIMVFITNINVPMTMTSVQTTKKKNYTHSVAKTVKFGSSSN